VFTFLFTAEVLIKLVGLGFKNFFSQSFNRFDFVIVMTSIIEMEMASSSGVFSALRAFRLFKIFKLFKVGDLRVLLDSISFTVIAIGDYVILLGLFIYVFALIGMSFFAGSLKFNEDD
jgi:voltage-dependent calcium channel L type alpha-1S